MDNLIFSFRKKDYLININNLFLFLIFLSITVNFSQIFSPHPFFCDAEIFFEISKYSVLHHSHWYDLYLNGEPWLDKPHFPFWLTIMSFKILGVNFVAYIIPGFIFHLIGLIYVYRLTFYLYQNKTISLLSSLIYISIISLMKNAVNVYAETYLLGEIIPAAYYWLMYDRDLKTKNLFLGGIFTALGMMTKGIFIIIPVFSGIIGVLFFHEKFKEIFSIKWLKAFFVSLIFLLPEVIADYLQFGREGIYWFFIESQFGRFFNSARIFQKEPISVVENISSIFVRLMPWTPIFVLSLYYSAKEFSNSSKEDKTSTIFILTSFFIMFIFFNLSKFRGMHYFYICFPFAAILSARYFFQYINQEGFLKAQLLISKACFLYTFIGLLSFYSRWVHDSLILICLFVIVGLFFLDKFNCLKSNLKLTVILYTVFAVNMAFLGRGLFNDLGYKNFDALYQSQVKIKKIQKNASLGVINYSQLQMNLTGKNIFNFVDIPNIDSIYNNQVNYILLKQDNLEVIQQKYSNIKVIARDIKHLRLTSLKKSLYKFKNSSSLQSEDWAIIKIS